MRLTFLSLFLATSALFATPVFIGTNATGIYVADFDAATGKLTEPAMAAEYKSPGWIAMHPTKSILYSIGSPKTPFPEKGGAVAAFSVSADQKLSFLGEAPSHGSGPCHLAIDSSGKALAVANYGDGTMTLIPLDEKFVPKQTASKFPVEGSGPHPRQKGPHSHGVYFDKSSKYLFDPDLGLDAVLIYKLSEKNGEVTASADPVRFKTAPGAGPRHMCFSPDEKHAYIINELDSTILAASYDGKGMLTAIGTVPTLPADFTGKSTTAEVEVHPNGKFVYGSNRGHDSIVVFARDAETGKLTFVQHAPCGGKTPRHFKIDPTGKWLLCGHQDSNGISVLALDPEKGTLGAPSTPVSAPSPICILFGK